MSNYSSTRIRFNLQQTLSDMRISMNYLSVRSKIRPATIISMCNGTSKEINLKTLKTLLDTLNEISHEYKLNKSYTIEDIFEYVTYK